MKKPYLLFDAGGTLVFPKMDVLIEIATKYGLQKNENDVFTVYCELIYEMDLQTQKSGALPIPPYPKGVGWAFFEKLGLTGDKLGLAAQEVTTSNKNENFWTFTYPWVFEVLEGLRNEGYRMSVLSNADGRVKQSFVQLGLDGYFERIFDSHILGVEKPDPRIFEIALSELGLQPEETLYIGDVFYIDVWGANQVGMPAVHLDPRNLYKDWTGVHIPSVGALAAILAERAITDAAFTPLKGMALKYD